MRAAMWLLLISTLPATVAMAQQDTAATRPPAKGAYSDSQATRGKDVYREVCSACHLPNDHANADFRQNWNGRTVRVLYDYIRSTMPDDAPGELSEQQYLDATAYILKLNGMPVGELALTADTTFQKYFVLELKAQAP